MHFSSLTMLGVALTAPVALAQTWTERGEAGNLPGTAQVVTGSGPLFRIDGNIDDPSDPLGAQHDRDMFCIRIDTPSVFTATTVGGTTLDTQMFLFDQNGLGVAFDDDDPPTGALQSTVTGAFVPAPGLYYLAVSRYDMDATSFGLAIWNDSPYGIERQPDGPGAAGAVDGWAGNVSSPTTGPYSILLTGVSNQCRGFHGSDFEAPEFSASAAGTLLTGQGGGVAYYLPPAATSTDFNVYTYTGNALGLPQNPNGGDQFIGGTGPGTSTFARAQKDIVYPSTGTVTVGFDIAATFTGTLPASQNLGSYSIQPVPGSSSFAALANWANATTATAWNADFVWYDAAGTQRFESVADPGFQNLPVNTWYRWEIDVNFTDNRILEVRLTDLGAGTTVADNPVGRYMEGGTTGTGQPAGFRFFAGAADPAGNALAFDNLCMSAAGFFVPSGNPIALGSVPGTDDFSVTLNEDETYMIFASNRPGGIGGSYDLYETWRATVHAPWAPPRVLPVANTPNNEWEPNLVRVPGAAPNTYELYYITQGGGLSDVWTVVLGIPGNAPAVVASPATPAPGNVNQPGWLNDDPCVTDDGLSLFYTTDAGGLAAGGADIHTATRPVALPGTPWTAMGPFGPANSGSLDHSPLPEANGNIVWFSSDRPGGSGGSSDVYVTFNDNAGGFSPPVEASNCNTADWESNLWRRGVTGRMYFSRFLSGGARLFCDCFGVASTFVRFPSVPGTQVAAVPMAAGLDVISVGAPWPMSVTPVRTWQAQRGDVLLFELYDGRPQPAGALYGLLISGQMGVVGPSPPFLPNLEVGSLLLNQGFLFTHAVVPGTPDQQATIAVPVPSMTRYDTVLSYQCGVLNGFPAPGGPIGIWGEAGRVVIQ